MNEPLRCPWSTQDPVMTAYHDMEWGMPVYDDRIQFEFLVLESAQAGLSWLTVLRRRKEYQRLYKDFNAGMVAGFGEAQVFEMLADPGIIRNRRKIEASINNARRFLEIQAQHGSFSDYLWGFNEGRQVVNHFRNLSELPSTSQLSDRISKDLKKKGFQFLGSTILYAHLQATGMVNDHLTSCFRHHECIL